MQTNLQSVFTHQKSTHKNKDVIILRGEDYEKVSFAEEGTDHKNKILIRRLWEWTPKYDEIEENIADHETRKLIVKGRWYWSGYYIEHERTCVCTQPHIARIHRIWTYFNDRLVIAEIGSECVKHFVSEEEYAEMQHAEKIIEKIRTFAKDYEKGQQGSWLSRKDIEWCIRNLPGHSWQKYESIKIAQDYKKGLVVHTRIIEQMRLKDPWLIKIIAITIFAKTKPKFDTTFITSIRAHYMMKKSLTLKQKQSIDKIISSFKISWRTVLEDL